MELDFKSVRALSSPTRVKILNQVMDKEATPTRLSEELGKSKSTISSHLDKLVEAGLIDKDEEEGRKRVVYNPTRKADAIVKGKERKVKFTLASSVVSMLAGLALVGGWTREKLGGSGAADPNAAMTATEFAAGSAKNTGQSSELVNFSPEIFLIAGILFLGISVISFLYGITVRKISR
ncbi:MAG: ArsR/SmtB family transcription factor [Candidatus Nanohaloarchaea archaeon]